MPVNRFGGLCQSCSVFVPAQCGVVNRVEGRWDVSCRVCDAAQSFVPDENDPDGDDFPIDANSGCAPSISLRVLGLARPCWKCGQLTTCVVGLYPDTPAKAYWGLVTTDGESALTTAVSLLRGAGQIDLAATIKPRYSRAAQARYLSNGCRHCDALQGDFPLSEDLQDAFVSKGVEGLDCLAIAPCPTSTWHELIHHHGGGWIG